MAVSSFWPSPGALTQPPIAFTSLPALPVLVEHQGGLIVFLEFPTFPQGDLLPPSRKSFSFIMLSPVSLEPPVVLSVWVHIREKERNGNLWAVFPSTSLFS